MTEPLDERSDTFHTALTVLHRLAGEPKSVSLVARMRQDGGNPSPTTIDGWLKGETVPRDKEHMSRTVKALVKLAEEQGGVPVHLKRLESWTRRVEQARDAKRAKETVAPDPPEAGGLASPVPPASVSLPVPRSAVRPRGRTMLITSLTVIALAAAGWGWSRWDSHPADSAKGPLYLTSSWPEIKECDGVTSVAMPVGGPAPASFLHKNVNFITAVTEKGGATWGSGHLYLTLSAQEGKTVVVEDIRLSTRLPAQIDPPAWIGVTQSGCGGFIYGREFDLDLDKPSLVDKGVTGEPEPNEARAKANPLGPAFTVSATDPAVIRVDVTACSGNYEWSLYVDYSYAGRSYRKLVGPFRSMGVRGENTVGYTSTGNYSVAGPAPEKGVGCGSPRQG
ncbi:hypothetical protein [Streptomyces sp. NPDC001389]|uniref:hypothetical protein n=1 Tax=Streptomyces sp. NPDC001389 TaxID=3364569 RepID=UPI0036BC67D4